MIDVSALNSNVSINNSFGVCFSMRKVNPNYSGPCLRIRRASDNTEQDINFSSGVVDSASLTTFISGTTGFVAIWYDQSGNSRHASQTITASQPQIILNQLNGYPIIRFDGVDDYLTHSVIITSPQSLHVFGVCKKISRGAGVARLVWSHRTELTRLIQFGYNDIGVNPTQPLIADGRGSLNSIKRLSSIAYSDLNWNIFNFLFTKNGIQVLRLHNTIITVNSSYGASETFNASLCYIGVVNNGTIDTSTFSDIEVAEIQVIKTAIDNYSANLIQQNINAAYLIY